MRPAQRSYMQTLRCDATLEGLWQALVRPAAVRLWHADQAAIDPRVGGRYAYRSRLFGLRQARIDTFEPGRRLRLVYDPNPSWPAAGDDPIVEDFLLGMRRNGTRKPQGELRLIGTGVPADPDLLARDLAPDPEDAEAVAALREEVSVTLALYLGAWRALGVA
jgi:uncharacterized protein YndB with AHSA1/START domain